MTCCGTPIILSDLEEKFYNVTMTYPFSGDMFFPDSPVYPIYEPPKTMMVL